MMERGFIAIILLFRTSVALRDKHKYKGVWYKKINWRTSGVAYLLLSFRSASSSSRILAESQNHLVRRSQGLGRHKRKNATEEGRATHAGERGETHDKAAASCGRQAGPQHAATAIVSPTYIQSRCASKSPADF